MLIPNIVRLGQLMHEIDRQMGIRQNNNLASLGITIQQGMILVFLYMEKDKKITQRMIEKRLNMTNPTITNIIKIMVNKNLVYKLKDKEDRRQSYLYLTPNGLELAPKCGKIMEATDRQAYRNLSDDELETLIRLLKKVDI